MVVVATVVDGRGAVVVAGGAVVVVVVAAAPAGASTSTGVGPAAGRLVNAPMVKPTPTVATPAATARYTLRLFMMP